MKKINGLVKEAFDYVRENALYVWLIAFVFAGAAIMGFVFSGYFVFLDEMIRELASKIEGKNAFELIILIFFNNSSRALMGLFFGVALGVMPFINSLVNGVLIGYVMKRTWEIAGVGEFWRLLPHGIFELPAIFIALGMGVKLGGFVFSRKGVWGELRRRAWKSLLVFVFIIIPLLVVAAIIEGVLVALSMG